LFKDENVLVDHKGVCYRKDEKGTLRKMKPNIINGILVKIK